MKKIFFIALMLFVSLLSVDECMAQNRIGSSKSNQSIDSKKKVEHNKWSKEHEEALNKKKKQQPVQTQNIVNKAKEQTKQKEVVKEEKKIIGIIKIKRNSIIVTTTINKDILLIEIYFL